jgi:hypothetical protein
MNGLELSLGIVAIITVGLLITVIFLWKKLAALTLGAKAKNLETIIVENNLMAKEIKKTLIYLNSEIAEIKNDALFNIQNIGVVRFNPFKETGGSQSFAIALTDKKDSGVVISSLYTRDRINVFAKPIINGESEYTLTKEEKSAIKKSRIK